MTFTCNKAIPRDSRRAPLRATLLLTMLCCCGCAGYQIGNRGLFPEGIHTVYVPVFQSNSFRRNLGEQLTEAVVKEIEKKTDYKVVDDPNADSVLTGRLISDSKTVLAPALSGDAREIQAAMTVQVSWVDRQGRNVRPDKNIPLPSEIADVTGTANIVPEVGQSYATAQQQAISRMAEQIVGMMEKPW
jgi:hypothetical protein